MAGSCFEEMPMRNQLQKFTQFANTLLPHETEYLLAVQQFQDEKRLDILRLVDYNAHHIDQFTPYDTQLDKRKYNHLKNWIKERLEAVDVDKHFNWMLEMEQQIATDTIQTSEEKELLKAIRAYQHPAFFFTKFYELIEHYRHFLLIRLRYADHQLANDFLKKYQADYQLNKKVNEKLHDATLDIVGQYSGKKVESSQWTDWLSEVFYDDRIDGLNRYLALVRLVFISHNYRKYDLLRKKFDHLDRLFSQGIYYSKRLLLNYYSNRLMLHSNFREYDRAVYFGYLSIRSKNHDYLFYVNNLCAVLLRLKRYQEALQLIQKASPEAKKTKNFHNRVGYVAFYMEALNKNGLYKNAEGYGGSFLKAYAKEVLQYRWHLFFSVYLESLVQRAQFESLLRIAQKYKLLELDKTYRSTAAYLPVIPIYIEGAKYKEGLLSQKGLLENIAAYLKQCKEDKERMPALKKLLVEMKSWLPELGKIQ